MRTPRDEYKDVVADSILAEIREDLEDTVWQEAAEKRLGAWFGGECRPNLASQNIKAKILC